MKRRVSAPEWFLGQLLLVLVVSVLLTGFLWLLRLLGVREVVALQPSLRNIAIGTGIIWFLATAHDEIKKNKEIALGLIIFFGLLAAVASLAVYGIFISEPSEFEVATSRVCDGEPMSAATEFSPDSPGPHPVFVTFHYKNEDGSVAPNGWLPDEWRPEIDPGASIKLVTTDLELVACLDETLEEVVETCKYIGGSNVRRVQESVRIDLYAAKPGELVGALTVAGPLPSECPEVVVGGKTEIRAKEVPAKGPFLAVLEPYVRGGGD